MQLILPEAEWETLTQFGCGGTNHQLMNGEKIIRGGQISNKLSTEEKFCPLSKSYLPNVSIFSLLSSTCLLLSFFPFTAIFSFVLLLPPGYRDQAVKSLCHSPKLWTSSLQLTYIGPSLSQNTEEICLRAFRWNRSVRVIFLHLLSNKKEPQIFIITTNDFPILLELYLPSLRCKKAERLQNICLWPLSMVYPRLASSLQQRFDSIICHCKR